MENRIISIDTFQKLLKSREMKNVLGGSGVTVCVDGECVCGAYCTSDSQCEAWYGF